eukprot:EG_transcript_9092
MWKKNKDFQSCPGVRCPDTIVYDHNFPRGWYTYDQKNKELKKKQGKELDTSSILASFSRSSDPHCDIVASYLYSFEEESGESVTSVEFFTKDDLTDFLNNRKTKKEGILQKFLVSKGLNNSLIQAVWSPRVCIVQRKTNKYAINDKTYSPYERAVTYEGPSHFTDDGICAPKTTAQIKSICTSICQHFQNTEHKNITRMVLYFKVDRNDAVWLLWCGSVRISDRQHQSQMPLNLSPIFMSPDQQSKAHGAEPEEGGSLSDVDHQQYHLSGDRMFQLTHCSPKASPKAANRPRDHAFEEVDAPEQRTELVANTAATKEVKAERKEWYMHDAHVHDQYKHLKLEHELVVQMLDDVFYEAYSHFQRHNVGAFFFSLPVQLRQLLGEEQLETLMNHLGIAPVPPSDLAGTGELADVPDMDMMDFWIPDIRKCPVGKLCGESQVFLKKLYGRREAALKKVALGGDSAGDHGIGDDEENGGRRKPSQRPGDDDDDDVSEEGE